MANVRNAMGGRQVVDVPKDLMHHSGDVGKSIPVLYLWEPLSAKYQVKFLKRRQLRLWKHGHSKHERDKG